MTAVPEGRAAERTVLSRHRTVLPLLAVAALALRGLVQGGGPVHPWPDLAVVLLAVLGAGVAWRGGPTRLTVVVVLLAGAVCFL